jgi:hypothetical protein
MREAAENYFADGSVELAVPPLQALLHIMRRGTWEEKGPDDPTFRALFSREAMLTSDWYKARLAAQQTIDVRLAERQVRYLEKFLTRSNYADVARRLQVRERLDAVIAVGREARKPGYLDQLHGTIGAEPSIAKALSQHALE